MDNNAYLPFVPLHLLSQLDKRPDLTDGRTFEPFSETVFGTVLFADISGFTKLSTKLSSEQLKIHINNYFGRLIAVVHSHHGDCIKFCGDAVMILWSVGEPSTSQLAPGEEGAAAGSGEAQGPAQTQAADRRVAEAATAFCASLCALELVAECGAYKVHVGADPDAEAGACAGDTSTGTDAAHAADSATSGSSPAEDNVTGAEGTGRAESVETYTLSLHCGVASGVINCLCLGGGAGPATAAANGAAGEERWEYLLSGHVLKEVGVATDHAVSGDVCLSPTSNALVGACFESDAVMAKAGVQYDPEAAGAEPVCFKLTGSVLARPGIDRDGDRDGDRDRDRDCDARRESIEKQDAGVRQFSVVFDTNNPVSSASAAADSLTVDGASAALCLRRELCLDNLAAAFLRLPAEAEAEVVNAQNIGPSSGPELLPRRTSTGVVMNYVNKRLSTGAVTADAAGTGATSPQRALSRGICSIVAALSPAKRGSALATASPFAGEHATSPQCQSPASRMFTVRRSSTATPPPETPVPIEAFPPCGGRRRLTQMNNLTPASIKIVSPNTDAVSFTRRGTQMNGDAALLGIDVSAFGVDSEEDAVSYLGASPLDSNAISSPLSPVSACAAVGRRTSVGQSLYHLCSSVLASPVKTLGSHGGSSAEGAPTLSEPTPGTLAVEPVMAVSAVDLWRWRASDSPRSSGQTSLQGAYRASRAVHEVVRYNGTKRRVHKAVLTAARGFVHEAALRAIENGNLSYIAEIRQIITVFIGLENLQEDFDSGLLARPQQALQGIVAATQRFGGSLRQFVVDDKGCVAILSFGTPGACHENNIPRAIGCCLALQRTLREAVDVSTRIGISQGVAYCGLVGSEARCEYAMMGACVNLSARIMGACPLDDVLVDEHVYRGRAVCGGTGAAAGTDDAAVPAAAAGSDKQQEVAEFISIHCKGYEDPVKVFSVRAVVEPMTRANTRPSQTNGSLPTLPLERGSSATPMSSDSHPDEATGAPSQSQEEFSAIDHSHNHNHLIGRESELNALLGAGSASGTVSRCSMLLVEGGIKSGKSALLWEFVKQQQRSVPSAVQVVLLAGPSPGAYPSLLLQCILQLITGKMLMLNHHDALEPSPVAAAGALPDWLLRLGSLLGKPAFALEISHLGISHQLWLLEYAVSHLLVPERLLAFLENGGIARADTRSQASTIDGQDTVDQHSEGVWAGCIGGGSGRQGSARVGTVSVKGRLRLSTMTEAACATITGGNLSTKSDTSVSSLFRPSGNESAAVNLSRQLPVQQQVPPLMSARGRGPSNKRGPVVPMMNSTVRLSSRSSKSLVPGVILVSTCELCGGTGSGNCSCSNCSVANRTYSSACSGSSATRRSTVSEIPMHAGMRPAKALLDLSEEDEEEEARHGRADHWLGVRGLVRALVGLKTFGKKRRGSQAGIPLRCLELEKAGDSLNDQLEDDAHQEMTQEQLVLRMILESLAMKPPASSSRSEAQTPAPVVPQMLNGGSSSETSLQFIALILEMLCAVVPPPREGGASSSSSSPSNATAVVSVLIDDLQYCDMHMLEVLVGLQNRCANRSDTVTAVTPSILIAGFAVTLAEIPASAVLEGASRNIGSPADPAPTAAGAPVKSRFSNLAQQLSLQRVRVARWRDACMSPGASGVCIKLKPFTLADVSCLLDITLTRFNHHLRMRCERVLATGTDSVRVVEVQLALAGMVVGTPSHGGAKPGAAEHVPCSHASSCLALSGLILEKAGGMPSYVQFYCRWVLEQMEAQSDDALESLVLLEAPASPASESGKKHTAAVLGADLLGGAPQLPPAVIARGVDDVYTMTNTNTFSSMNAAFSDAADAKIGELAEACVLPVPPCTAVTAAVATVEAVEVAQSFMPTITIDISNLPRGPEDLLLGNFDKLSGKHQFVLKAASVIGLSFDILLLQKILQKQHLSGPSATVTSFPAMQATIRELEILEWVVRADGHHSTTAGSGSPSTSKGAGVMYRFADEKSQGVVYKLMLNAQKVLIHSYVALQYEMQYRRLMRLLVPAPTAAETEFPRQTASLVGQVQVQLSKLLHHFEMSRNIAKVQYYSAMALLCERWILAYGSPFPVSHSGGSLCCEANLLSHCEALLTLAVRKPYALFLNNPQGGALLQGSSLANVPGAAAHNSRLARILVAVSKTRPSCADFAVTPGTRSRDSCTFRARLARALGLGSGVERAGLELKKPRIGGALTVKQENSISFGFSYSGASSLTGIDDALRDDVFPAIWWLQAPERDEAAEMKPIGRRNQDHEEPRFLMQDLFCCLSPKDNVWFHNRNKCAMPRARMKPSTQEPERSFTERVLGLGIEVSRSRDLSKSFQTPTHAIDTGSGLNVCDVGYLVGELGLAAVDRGDIDLANLLFYQTHKLLLLSHGPVVAAFNRRAEEVAEELSDGVPLLPYSTLYSQQYIAVCYLLFYLYLGWHCCMHPTLYDLQLAGAVAQFGGCALHQLMEQFACTDSKFVRRDLQDLHSEGDRPYFKAILAAMELGFNSLTLMVAVLKADSATSAASAEWKTDSVAVLESLSVDVSETEEGAEDDEGEDIVGTDCSSGRAWGAGTQPSRTAKAKTPATTAPSSAPTPPPAPTLGLDAETTRTLAKLTDLVTSSQKRFLAALVLIDLTTGSDRAAPLAESTPVLRGARAEAATWSDSEAAHKHEPLRKPSGLAQQSRCSSEALTATASLHAGSELSGAVYRGILERVRHFSPLIRSVALARQVALSSLKAGPASWRMGLHPQRVAFRYCRDSLIAMAHRRDHPVWTGSRRKCSPASLRQKVAPGGVSNRELLPTAYEPQLQDWAESLFEAVVAGAAKSYSVPGSSGLVSLLVSEVMSSSLLVAAVLGGQQGGSSVVAGLAGRCLFTLREYCAEELRYVLGPASGERSEKRLIVTKEWLLREETRDTATPASGSIGDEAGTKLPSIQGSIAAVSRYQRHWALQLQQVEVFLLLLETIRNRLDCTVSGSGSINGNSSNSHSNSGCSGDQLFDKVASALDPVEFTGSYAFVCQFSENVPIESSSGSGGCDDGPTSGVSRCLRCLYTLDAVLLQTRASMEEGGADGCSDSIPCQSTVKNVLALCLGFSNTSQIHVTGDGDGDGDDSSPADSSDGWYLDCAGYFCSLYALKVMTARVEYWLEHLQLSPTLPGLRYAYQLPHPRSEGTSLLKSMRGALREGYCYFASMASGGPTASADATVDDLGNMKGGAAAGSSNQDRASRCLGDRSRALHQILFALLLEKAK